MGIEFEVIYKFKYLKFSLKSTCWGVKCNLFRMLLSLHTILQECARAYTQCQEGASALTQDVARTRTRYMLHFFLDPSGPTEYMEMS